MSRDEAAPDQELLEILARGRRHIKRARILGVAAITPLILHFEFLVLPFALEATGLEAVLLIAYPIVFGTLALAGLWVRPSRLRYGKGTAPLHRVEPMDDGTN